MEYPIQTSENKEAIRKVLPITRLSSQHETKAANLVFLQNKQGKKVAFWIAKRCIKPLKGGKFMRIALPLHFTYQPYAPLHGSARLEPVGDRLSATDLEQKHVFCNREMERQAIHEDMEQSYNDSLAFVQKKLLSEKEVPAADQKVLRR